jgi:ankyrin repeat protein
VRAKPLADIMADEDSSDLPDVGEDVNNETDVVVKKKSSTESSKSSTRKSKRESDGSADDNDDLPRFFPSIDRHTYFFSEKKKKKKNTHTFPLLYLCSLLRYSIENSTALHVAAANAHDSIKESLNSALAVLRELLVIGVPSAATTTTTTTTTTNGTTANAGVVVDDEHSADSSDRSTSLSQTVTTTSDVQYQRAQRPDGSRKRISTPAKQKSLRTRRVEWLEARDPDGCTPLHVASSAGNSIASQLLIDAGADVDATDIDGATPLHKACANGHITTILVLLRAGAKRTSTDNAGRTPLHYAVDDDCVDALDALLMVDSGALPLLSPRAHTSPRNNAKSADDGAGGSKREESSARTLLAICDINGMSVLHRIARSGARRCMTRVRARYSSLLPTSAIDARDSSGLTPLHHAALAGSASCVRQLVALGCDVGALVQQACDRFRLVWLFIVVLPVVLTDSFVRRN